MGFSINGNSIYQQMTSVERIKHYGSMKPEATEHIDYPLPQDWPTAGAIVFDDVTLTYIDGHPPALKDVSFSICCKEKVLFRVII